MNNSSLNLRKQDYPTLEKDLSDGPSRSETATEAVADQT